MLEKIVAREFKTIKNEYVKNIRFSDCSRVENGCMFLDVYTNGVRLLTISITIHNIAVNIINKDVHTELFFEYERGGEKVWGTLEDMLNDTIKEYL